MYPQTDEGIKAAQVGWGDRLNLPGFLLHDIYYVRGSQAAVVFCVDPGSLLEHRQIIAWMPARRIVRPFSSSTNPQPREEQLVGIFGENHRVGNSLWRKREALAVVFALPRGH